MQTPSQTLSAASGGNQQAPFLPTQVMKKQAGSKPNRKQKSSCAPTNSSAAEIPVAELVTIDLSISQAPSKAQLLLKGLQANASSGATSLTKDSGASQVNKNRAGEKKSVSAEKAKKPSRRLACSFGG